MRVRGPMALDRDEGEVGRTELRERMTGILGISLGGRQEGSWLCQNNVRKGLGRDQKLTSSRGYVKMTSTPLLFGALMLGGTAYSQCPFRSPFIALKSSLNAVVGSSTRRLGN